eukprot:SAG11_NODE_3063_length_2717_cov_1.987777_3_plen_142_part_00
MATHVEAEPEPTTDAIVETESGLELARLCRASAAAAADSGAIVWLEHVNIGAQRGQRQRYTAAQQLRPHRCTRHLSLALCRNAAVVGDRERGDFFYFEALGLTRDANGKDANIGSQQVRLAAAAPHRCRPFCAELDHRPAP